MHADQNVKKYKNTIIHAKLKSLQKKAFYILWALTETTSLVTHKGGF